MSRIFIIGATGKVGARLARLLVGRGHQVAGLHRSSGQAEELAAMGVEPVEGDLVEISSHELAVAMAGCDAVVFSAGAAGSGMERTTAIDGGGVIKMIEAAKLSGTRRVYLVSVFMDAGRQRERSERFEHYIQTKREADVALCESGLDWLILRPGRLHDEAGNGRVRAGLAVAYGTTARDNVAALLAALVELPEIHGRIIEMTDGETPVSQAAGNLSRS